MPWDKARKSSKLRARFYGPFEIMEQLGPVSYRLKIPPESKIHDVFHVALLKPAKNFDHVTQGHLVDEFPMPDENQEFEVERILAKRTDDHGRTFYLVKWHGYQYDDSTWEPDTHLANSTRAVEEFEMRSHHARYPTHEDLLADEIYTQSH